MLCGQRTTDEMRASLIYLGPMGNIINWGKTEPEVINKSVKDGEGNVYIYTYNQ